MSTAEGYCEWMAEFGSVPLNGCSYTYTLNTSAYDEANNTAIFYGTFNGTHVREVAPFARLSNQRLHTMYTQLK